MRTEVIELRIVEGNINASYHWFTFYLGRHELGRAYKKDGGWMVGTKRKPLPTEIHAAKAMIDRLISKADKDRAFALDLLKDLRLHNGGTLPPTR